MSERPSNENELIELIRAIDVPAPERLHDRTAAMIAERAKPARDRAYSPRLRLGAASGLAVAAAVVLALVIGSGGSGAGRLSVRSAAALALASPTGPAPAESSSHRAQLAASVDGVAFPYWGDRFGWRSTGSRSERLGGRRVTAVFDANQAGQRSCYAIDAG